MSDSRRPAVAGYFYPSSADELRRLVSDLLDPVPDEQRPCHGVMVPHAGLVYSGQCAARVLGRIRIPHTVVILAPNHTGVSSSPGAGLWQRGTFRTPLGDVAVDEAFASELAGSCELVAHDPDAHAGEHAVEVQLPFLLARSPNVTIVPLVLAFVDWPRCEQLGHALADMVKDRPDDVLLMASTDMTHYESAARVGHKDRLALDAIEKLEPATLLERCRTERISMCGRAPAACMLDAARRLGATRAEVIDYCHSGHVTGDDSSVVGYAGVIVS